MEKIDFFILEKFQKFSDFINNEFGLNNFRLARISLHLLTLFSIVQSILSLRIKFTYFVAIFDPIMIIIFYKLLDSFLERAINSTSNSVFKNIYVKKFYWIRIFFLTMFISSSLSLLLRGGSESTGDISMEAYKYLSHISLSLDRFFEILFLYFVSCTPKPKKPSRLKKFISKISTSLSKSPTPAFG